MSTALVVSLLALVGAGTRAAIVERALEYTLHDGEQMEGFIV